MLKIKEKDSAVVRLLKALVQGVLIGGLVGLPIGYVLAKYGGPDGLVLPIEAILTYVQGIVYGVMGLMLLIGLVYIFLLRKEMATYEETEDDDLVENLYRHLGKRLGYATVFVGIGLVMGFVNVTLGYRVNLTADSASLSIPFVAIIGIAIFSGLQIYLLSLNHRLRGTKSTLAPTMKELKANVLQLDEAELEANYKMCFDIVMTLSGLILPGIYILLLIMAFIFQKVELTGIFIAAGIHLYIMIMNFKMVKTYYK